jgi:hypothetical protein
VSNIQHPISPRMDRDAAFVCLAINAANVAVRIVETHQAMNIGDDQECRIDRLFHCRARWARAADFDERAQKWPGAANAIGTRL